MGNICDCRSTTVVVCSDDRHHHQQQQQQRASGRKRKKKKEEVDAPRPQCSSPSRDNNNNNNNIFDECPPQELIIRTAHGNTAVHIFNSEAADTTTTTTTSSVLMVHGAGGRKEQFAESRLAQSVASTPYRVITFDWYGHGSSSSTRDNSYSKENFLEQMHAVVTTLIPEGQRFHLYGFSMGCFLSLHYIRLYPDRIDRSVLHSPWNAEMGVFCPCSCSSSSSDCAGGGGALFKSTVRIPFLGIMGVAIVRHLLFPYCHNAMTLKKIIVTLGEGSKAWCELLDSLATAGTNPPPAMLIICGKAEKPFFHLAELIHETFSETSEIKCYPKARHMTWCQHWDQQAGEFFRGNIYNFLK